MEIESFRSSFKNDFGSFTSVFVYVNHKNKKEFMVRSTIRKSIGNGLLSIQVKEKWIPMESWDLFLNDLKNREK